ncbi:glycosyltransferase [Calycomorphotria hydatis]|uniref:Putative glycosyl transferase n=1 Tax=Calycomorphotria hydatis TaxID=2528027 RepID=A0A517TCR6_9PLAN|nr:glycosyltransferase [Calycomorphotria hydatis]QDT66169.1 putative glycosyl transferase [Calycomorphotria hydatis]
MNQSEHNPAETQPTITVAICTRNRAEALLAALMSLSELKTNGLFTYELLVIDNASSDHTASVAKEVRERLSVPVRHVREEQPGVAFARNRAVAECRGTWLAFFDDDQAAEADWLLELFDLTVRRNAVCVGGKVVLRLPGGIKQHELDPVCQMLLGASVGMETERRYSVTVTPGAGNLMIRRDIFDKVGAFDIRLNGRGEDTELFHRILAGGFGGWYSPKAIIHHIIPPERLQEEYLLRLSRKMSEGMAEDERDGRGRWIYPLVYAARWGQFLGLLVPRYALAKIRGDQAALLGSRCRIAIASGYLHNGFRLMVGLPAMHDIQTGTAPAGKSLGPHSAGSLSSPAAKNDRSQQLVSPADVRMTTLKLNSAFSLDEKHDSAKVVTDSASVEPHDTDEEASSDEFATTVARNSNEGDSQ